MAFVSPVGGNVIRTDGVNVIIPVGQWQGNWEGRPADVTQTDGGGGTSYRVNVVDPQWTFTLFLDDTDAAVAAGFTPGTIMTVAFKLGSLATCDLLTNTTVIGISRSINASGEAIGVTLNGRGGLVTLNAAVPA